MLIIVNLCIYIEWLFFWNNFSWIQCYRRIKLRSFCCRWNSNSTKRLMRKARGGGTCPSKSRRQKNLTYILNDKKFRKWTFPLFEKSEWNHHLKNPLWPPKNLREPCVSSGTTEASRIPGSRDPSARPWKRTKSAGWFSHVCTWLSQKSIGWQLR